MSDVAAKTIAPPVRMIALDMDGTLLPSIGGLISERNRRALLAADAAGIEIVIATGRRQAYAMPLLRQLDLAQSTVIISSNGTVSRTFAGKTLHRTLMPVETARSLCGLMRSYGTLVFTFDREGPGELVIESLVQLHARIAKWVEANRSNLVEIVPLEQAFESGDTPVQGMVCGTIEQMRQAEGLVARSEFAADIEMHRTEYAEQDLCILDLLPPGVSKGTALKRLADLRGIAREDVLAIGDNYNDFDMLEYAGQRALMSNAPEELIEIAKDRGWSITDSNDEDGVAAAIEAAMSASRSRNVESVGVPLAG
jgi:hypothetical protein